MIPWLSRLSVTGTPDSRFRHRRSSRYLRISPLHREFHCPLMPSSAAVAPAVPRLGRGISPKPYRTAYAPFKPSDTEQRLPPLYYRGCWHRVSRGFLSRLCQRSRYSLLRIHNARQRFTIQRPSSRTRRRSVRLASIAEDSRLQPPVGVWAVLSPSVGGQPLSPPTRRRLGEPLPHQLADRS